MSGVQISVQNNHVLFFPDLVLFRLNIPHMCGLSENFVQHFLGRGAPLELMTA